MDITLFHFLFSFAGRSPLLDGVFVFIAEYLPYFMMLSLVIFILNASTRAGARLFFFINLMLVVLIARGLFTEIIRFFYNRLRPFEAFDITPLLTPAGYSFPSGHAAWLFSIAFFLLFMSRKWGAVFFVGALVVSAARVVSGIHFPLDILGGMAVGLVAALIVRYLLPPSLFGQKFDPIKEEADRLSQTV